jgi:rsbT co-antagonist protein RsbR
METWTTCEAAALPTGPVLLSQPAIGRIDITGVQAVDSKVANHMVQTVEAARLMGATVIVAGAPEIAQTMVTLGIDLGRMTTVGDLQSGIEKAEELLRYTVTRIRPKAPVAS